jgi:cobalt-zinc-cadmium efflux system protein
MISRDVLERKFRTFVALSASILVLEIIGGVVTDSLALLSDSFHVLTDLVSMLLAYFSIRLAKRGANTKFTFGYYRAEIISAAMNGGLLFFITFYIFYNAYLRLINPVDVRSGEMLVISIIGLAANLYVAIRMRDSTKDNLNVRGAYLHVLSDTLSSVGVVAGGAIIAITGADIIDPIISIMIGCFILANSIGLIRESLLILMESTPKGIDIDSIERDMKGVEGVEGVHDIHVWSISSDLYAMSSHIIVDTENSARINEIVKKIDQMLKEKHNIAHTTIQSECDRCVDEKKIKEGSD